MTHCRSQDCKYCDDCNRYYNCEDSCSCRCQDGLTLITKICVRCDKQFEYGDMNKSLRGQMTRKYCDQCKILQHRDESRLYSNLKRGNVKL